MLLFAPIAVARRRMSPLWGAPALLWATPFLDSAGTAWRSAVLLGVVFLLGGFLLRRGLAARGAAGLDEPARRLGYSRIQRGWPMAIAYIQEFTIVDDDRTTAGYDAVAARLGDATIPGLIVHTAGFDEDAGVFRIFEVWESRDDAVRFQEETLGPILGEVMGSLENVAPPSRDGFYELHDLLP